MIQAKLTSKGQITLPKKIREKLGLYAGDQVCFIINQEGKIILTTQDRGLDQVFGMFSHKKRGKTTLEDMDRAIAERMRRKNT